MSVYTYTQNDVDRLETIAAELRNDVLQMIHEAGAGHPGGSLSCVEIITALYFHILRVDPSKPDWADRDRFVLSKGHACPTLYAALAKRGFFDPKELSTLRKYHSILQGHPDKNKTPGLDSTAGSLGNGLSVGLGMALSARVHHQDYSTYILLGDGELQEGMVWEAAMAAAHHNLKDLVALVDCNGVQINGFVNDILTIEPLRAKWESFGWRVIEADGHDMNAVLHALHTAKTMRAPTAILFRTVKGKGVPFMEDDCAWHGKAPDEDELLRALAALKGGEPA